MTDDEPVTPKPTSRSGPGIVAPTSRVNVAFPFSKIAVQEPSKELSELSAIVAELTALLEDVSPGETITALRTRAQALAIRTG